MSTKRGIFNVPYGKYKKPKICDIESLYAASKSLQNAEIVCLAITFLCWSIMLNPGDFIFLDPPYLPISEYSDFKRYTKEQFYEEDHVELAKQVMRLHEKGCHVILTNSNHPLVHELYAPFKIDVIQTKRHISCNGNTRKGEDVIVTVPPKQRFLINLAPTPLPKQVSLYPLLVLWAQRANCFQNLGSCFTISGRNSGRFILRFRHCRIYVQNPRQNRN